MLVAGNWKMNYGFKELDEFFKLSQSLNLSKKVDLCIMPPSPLLMEAKKKIMDSKIKLGAQCSHYRTEGSFTGDISPKLLKEIGCHYVITGHSERRLFHFENNEFVKNTVVSIVNKGLVPIICVGETMENKNLGNTKNFIKKQIQESVPLIKDYEIIVAYEPLWAIGSGEIPNDKEIEEVHTLIKNELNSLNFLKVIYGGSVNITNCNKIFSNPNVDGALIGGASLNFKEFLAIYDSAVKQFK